MDRRVIRVSVPTVTEYDVVFEDDRPVFVGAVIRREASAKGPDAGKIVDTHRMTWDGRGGAEPMFRHPATGEPLSLASKIIDQAMQTLARSPDAGRGVKPPNQLSRPFERVRPRHGR
jgi:hypothetical protein